VGRRVQQSLAGGPSSPRVDVPLLPSCRPRPWLRKVVLLADGIDAHPNVVSLLTMANRRQACAMEGSVYSEPTHTC
jgi:hypothetical protein